VRLGSKYLEFRHNAMLFVMAAVALVPFALGHLLNQRLDLALVVGLAAASFGLLAAYVLWTRSVGLANCLLMITGLVAILVAMQLQGIYAVYWAFPLILAIYLLFALVPAVVINVLALGLLLPVMVLQLPAAHSSRLLVTLALVSVFTYLFARNVQESHEALERLAEVDPLTGVANRLRLDETLQDCAERLARHGLPTSLLVLDVDHFKAINDQQGHVVGDRILAELGSILRARIRRIDHVFRYGGEEFVIVLSGTDLLRASGVAEDLRRRNAQRRFPDGVRLTVSIGVAELDRNESATAWLARADQALYAAKQGGRNRVCLADRPARASAS
jgi:diguanylate cyclase (GGDEF)-like protein